MNFEIVVATTNKHKMKEYRAILAKHGITLYSFSDLNLTLPEVEENGSSYIENALIKAKAAASIVNMPVIADDSGLEVESLNNKPGIHTARFAKECGSQNAANQKIVNDTDINNRTASFHCAIALVNYDNNKPLVFEGIATGEITKEYHDEVSFGYDPIFYSYEAHETFHNLSEDNKNKLSHRAKACNKLLMRLRLDGKISK